MQKFNKGLLATTLVVFSVFGFMGPVVAGAAGPALVNLGSAGNFAILAKTGISTTGTTFVTGDIGVSPAAATYITGFSLNLPAASAFSTSPLVSGKVYSPDYANPTPANLTTAILDMQNAYTDGMSRAPSVTELGAGNIGGLTLAPGTYKWGTGVTIPTDVTLSGGANDVWIFQIAQNLNVSSAKSIVLSSGAQASNIFWVVAGQTTIGTTAVFNGNILDQTTIVLNTGARLNGRALAQAAVTLDANAVTTPSVGGYTAPVQTAVPVTTSSQTPVINPMVTYAPPVTALPPQAAVNAPTAQQIQLNTLLATLQALQIQASQRGTSLSASASSVPANGMGQARDISASLKVGNVSNDVKILQQFLIAQNKGSAAQNLARVGATARFGAMTRAALAEFQASVGISPATGNFGALTRAYIKVNY